MSEFPISKVCPRCGSKEYTSRKPKEFVAFANDRVCKVCLTRYSPPPPVWGGIVFVLCGLALPILGCVLIYLLFGVPTNDNPFNILGLVCGGAFCIFALVVFGGGIRLLESSHDHEA
jgi:hypothetical protein